MTTTVGVSTTFGAAQSRAPLTVEVWPARAGQRDPYTAVPCLPVFTAAVAQLPS